MIVKVEYYGQVAEIVGSQQQQIELGEASVLSDLIQEIESQFGDLAAIKKQYAVNNSMVDTHTTLNNNDLVAVLPPFAGG